MSSTNIHGQKRVGKEEREGLKKEGMRRRKEKRKTRRDGIDSGRIRIGTVQTRSHSTAQLLSVVLCWLEREKEWLPLPCKVEELHKVGSGIVSPWQIIQVRAICIPNPAITWPL